MDYAKVNHKRIMLVTFVVTLLLFIFKVLDFFMDLIAKFLNVRGFTGALTTITPALLITILLSAIISYLVIKIIERSKFSICDFKIILFCLGFAFLFSFVFMIAKAILSLFLSFF